MLLCGDERSAEHHYRDLDLSPKEELRLPIHFVQQGALAAGCSELSGWELPYMYSRCRYPASAGRFISFASLDHRGLPRKNRGISMTDGWR
jgi:hypothetical protein